MYLRAKPTNFCLPPAPTSLLLSLRDRLLDVVDAHVRNGTIQLRHVELFLSSLIKRRFSPRWGIRRFCQQLDRSWKVLTTLKVIPCVPRLISILSSADVGTPSRLDEANMLCLGKSYTDLCPLCTSPRRAGSTCTYVLVHCTHGNERATPSPLQRWESVLPLRRPRSPPAHQTRFLAISPCFFS